MNGNEAASVTVPLEMLELLTALCEKVVVGVAVFDEQLRYQWLNERLAEANELSIAEHLGRTLAEIPLTITPTIEPLIQRVFATGEPYSRIELRGHQSAHSTQTSYWLVDCYPLQHEQERVVRVGVIVNNISARKRAEMHQATRVVVTRILAEQLSRDSLAFYLLQGICANEGWDRGELWCVDAATQLLRLHSDFSTQALGIHQFAVLRQTTTFQSGIEIAGQVWASGKAELHSPLADHVPTPHTTFAVHAGFQEVFAFPIKSDTTIIGVMVFFSQEQHAHDAELLFFGEDIGSHIGQLFERRRVEERLQQSTKHLHALHAITQSILALQPPIETAQTTLRHVRAIVPCDRSSFLLIDSANDQATVWSDQADALVNKSYRVSALPHIQEALARGEPYLINDLLAVTTLSSAHQTLRSMGLRSHINVPIFAHGTLIGALNLSSKKPYAFTPDYISMLQDVTSLLGIALHNAQLFEQVQTGHTQLRAVANQLYQTSEAASHHLASELQDRLGQSLTAVHLGLEVLVKLPSAGAFATELKTNSALLEEGIQHIRTLSHNLRPPLLDELGLEPALQWLLKQNAQQGGFATTFSSTIGRERYASKTETTCMRVAQEALYNIVRYAHASNVIVTLTKTHVLQLVITDNGIGFDVKAAYSVSEHEQGMGLFKMQHVVDFVNGTFTITSGVGKGTTITVQLPLKL